MLVVWIVAVLVVLTVLGSVLFGLAGSLRRLRGELSALEREVEPVRTQAQQTAARAAAVRERSSNEG
jgi:predicted Holliday junction resolvase-like endonuclease